MACKQCGDCCRGIGVAMPMNVDMARFYSFRGYRMTKRPEGHMELWLDRPCQYYRAGIGCLIHESSSRPQICRDFLCEQAQGGDSGDHQG